MPTARILLISTAVRAPVIRRHLTVPRPAAEADSVEEDSPAVLHTAVQELPSAVHQEAPEQAEDTKGSITRAFYFIFYLSSYPADRCGKPRRIHQPVFHYG